MELLDRDEFLLELNNIFGSVIEGEGKIAAVCGDAGIGKTSLVETFTKQNEYKAEIFWGACDDLYTPRPLAPLYDMAGKMNSRIIENLDLGVPRPSIFTMFLSEINLKTASIVVIEDVHWADESTLDLIKFLAKRINKYRTLLLLTYRNDEINSSHPLKFALSNLSTKYYRRIELPPLSRKAVMKLAGNFGRSDENLYTKTGGNPFFVTEVLMNSEQEIPETIKDLIITRLNRLSSGSRNGIEILSVIPGAAEKWLVQILVKDFYAIDEAIESGILKADHDSILFRHELLKAAVEESLSEVRRIERNTSVLKILLEQKNTDPYLARIIHHAVLTANKDVITKYAPLAAKQASKASAHEKAAKLYLTAIQFSDQLSPEERLDLLEGRVHECYLTAQIEEGIKACEMIRVILNEHHDPLREGENYRRLSRLLWYCGKDKECEEYLIKAIGILEKLSSNTQLGMAYSNLSQIYMLREKTSEAIKWGEKALEISENIKDIEVQAHAFNNIGTSKMFAYDDSGEMFLKKSLKLSIDNELNEHACRAYVNLGTVKMYRRNLTEADTLFTSAIDYSNEKDISLADLCVTGEVGQIKLYMGRWDEALEISITIYERNNVPVMDKILPLCIIGLIKARKNDPGAFKYLDESNELMKETGELMKIVKVKASRAEAFWLKNELKDNIGEFIEAYDIVKVIDNPWAVGELALWLWKGGHLPKIPKHIAEPFFLQIKGNWAAAAELWQKLKCPYEQAFALADGDETAMKKAIVIFEGLGATAASLLLKHKLRKSGIKNIPKGPRQSTKENPSGLTERQLQILELISKGYSNSEIGNILYISVRTVENHIATLFFKLDIHSRAEAAAFVHSNQIVK
jgi:DNA-binding CsgD family transcriptional regulator/tetratricopeptide (TPR) repeat protein